MSFLQKGALRKKFTFEADSPNNNDAKIPIHKKSRNDLSLSVDPDSDIQDEFSDQLESSNNSSSLSQSDLSDNDDTVFEDNTTENAVERKSKMENFDDYENNGQKAFLSKAGGLDNSSDEEAKIKSNQTTFTSDEVETDSESNPPAFTLAGDTPTDLATLKARIEGNVSILSNFAKLRTQGIPRSTYVNTLIKDLCLYYGYSEYLISEHFFHMFTITELVQFLESSDVPRPITIRTNTLKIKRRKDLAKALISRGINVDPLALGDEENSSGASASASWSSLGLQVFEGGSEAGGSRSAPLGATPEYLSGLYMLQAAASFLPVVALAPGPGERVLDMCAAPGGKSTHCAQLMKNSGFLISNDLSKDRQKATAANIYRLGVRNAVISIMDGRLLLSFFGKNLFDKVLLDAPCSGTGVISKDPSVKVSKDESDFRLLTHTQKELILAAIDIASANNGVIVYSTCSVCVEENEQVVQYALEKRPNVKLVDTHLPFGRPGFINYRDRRFSPSMKLTMRYYPHVHNLDGFYVAKLIKTGLFPKNDRSLSLDNDTTTTEKV